MRRCILYSPDDYDTGQPVRTVNGEHDLFGDGTERNLDVMVLPKATANIEQGMETYRRLARLRNSGTRILFGHDGIQWKGVTEGVPFVL